MSDDDFFNLTEAQARELGCYEEWRRWQDAIKSMAESIKNSIDEEVLRSYKNGEE